MEGFKQQAPQFEDEIAFSAFYELSFNPALDIDGKKMAENHPIKDIAANTINKMKNGLSKKSKTENDT